VIAWQLKTRTYKDSCPAGVGPLDVLWRWGIGLDHVISSDSAAHLIAISRGATGGRDGFMMTPSLATSTLAAG